MWSALLLSWAGAQQPLELNPGTENQSGQRVPVVFLEWSEAAVGPEHLNSMLPRELGRQAVLVAARDELLWLTRDVLLGEVPSTHESAPSLRLQLQVEARIDRIAAKLIQLAPADKPVTSVSALATESAQGKVVWDTQFELPTDQLAAVSQMIERWEELSRTELPQALSQALANRAPGAGPAQAAQRSSSPVTAAAQAEIDTWLAEPSVYRQFQALRRLHAQRGEGPTELERLNRLVRGYTHLSGLSLYHWQPTHVVTAARALLYGQRLRTSPSAGKLQRWQAAYTDAVLGLHWRIADELPELSEPKFAQQVADDPWLSLIDPLVRSDFGRLREVVTSDSPAARVARAWKFLWEAELVSPEELRTLAHECREPLPGVTAVFWRSFYSSYPPLARWSMTTMAEQVPQLFVAWAQSDLGLPSGISDLRRLRGVLPPRQLPEMQFWQARTLTAAATEANTLTGMGASDTVELSWSVPAYLFREEFLLAAIICIANTSDLPAPDREELANQLVSVIREHRYAAFLQYFSLIYGPAYARAIPKLEKLELRDVTDNFGALTKTTAGIPNDLYSDIAQAARDQVHTEPFALDLFLPAFVSRRPVAREYAKLLQRTAPLSRIGEQAQKATIAWRNRREIAEAEQFLDPNDAAALSNLADLFRRQERTDLAIEYYSRSLAAAEDPDLRTLRANTAWLWRRYPLWESDLRKAIPLIEAPLARAGAANTLASGLMELDRWEESVEPAQWAAEVGSAWGYRAAAMAFEHTGRMQESEKMSSAESRGYDGPSRMAWYFWCHRTGNFQNLADARRVAADYTRSVKNDGAGHFFGATAAYLEGDRDRALRMFVRSHEVGGRTDAWDSLMAAWLADEAGQIELRDRILSEVQPRMEGYRIAYKFDWEEPVDTFVYALIEVLKKNQVEEHLEMADFYFPALWNDRRQDYGFLLGKLYERQQQLDLADYYWKTCMRGPDSNRCGATLSGAELIGKYGARGTWDEKPARPAQAQP